MTREQIDNTRHDLLHQMAYPGCFHAVDLMLDESLSHEEKVWILRQRILHLTAELRAGALHQKGGSRTATVERLHEAQRTLLFVMAAPRIPVTAS